MNNQMPFGFMPPFNNNMNQNQELRMLNERVDNLERALRRLERRVSRLENAPTPMPRPVPFGNNNSNFDSQEYPNNYMI